VIDPLFWLGLSLLLVATSLTALVVATIPVIQQLAHAARSAEKLFDTLSQELPPTLRAIRNTSLEITDLSDDVSESMKTASQVVQQVDQSLGIAKKQAQDIQISTRSVVFGFKAAWNTFTRKKTNRQIRDTFPTNDQTELRFRQEEVLEPEN
jgi:uncharacterized protein YoxC